MSYLVLARKWRPQRFSELVGQETIKQTLINALEQDKIHHAYLFSGTRGVGKTSIARIFAKSLNCEQGVSAQPCGECSSCIDIVAGRYVDLIEVDAASRTRVEDTKEILDNVQYVPTRGRFKVYLIDEVHMLSKHSFNALLKTLEEPPAYVKFLFATTDPQKLPVTILSRCLQFNLKALEHSAIAQQLNLILAQEQIPTEDKAIQLLAKAAKGSMRDALSLTDQAIGLSASHITVQAVQSMLGSLDQRWAKAILAAICQGDRQKVLGLTEKVAAFAPNYQQLLDDLLNYLYLGALTQIVSNAAELAEEDQEFIYKLTHKLDAETIQLYYQILLEAKRDLPLAPEPKLGFTMALIRLLAFNIQSEVVIEAPAQQINNEQSTEQDLAQQQQQIIQMALEQGYQQPQQSARVDQQQYQEPINTPTNNQYQTEPQQSARVDQQQYQEPINTPTNNQLSTDPLEAILRNRQQIQPHDVNQQTIIPKQAVAPQQINVPEPESVAQPIQEVKKKPQL